MLIFSCRYHLGEHHLLYGKSEPYDTDIRLPMYVRGPGIPSGVRYHPTNHLDITATIVDLLGISSTAPSNLDGLSFRSALTATPSQPTEWRNFSFTEFYVDNNTWHTIRVIDETSFKPILKFTWWCSNQAEVFKLQEDSWEMTNLGETAFGKSVINQYLPITTALGKCSAVGCHKPVTMPVTPKDNPLPCRTNEPVLDVEEAVFDP